MSWWSTSWLPSIPSIDFALPSGLQKRFISFTLRRALGHLLKPGQLDIQQVDSQIGSGYVQIRDVELDNNAINSLLAGLPLELHDGSVGKVTARIPLPNPVTSSVGLSLESLHLTFNVSPTISTASQSSNLAESMVSVAETFIHDELNDFEEAELRESLHADLAWSSHSMDPVPGGLDPFLSDRSTGNHDFDPPGVSVFATLVERLLARFEFDATDIKITLVHPGHASFTLTVPSIRYCTELKDSEQATSSAHTAEQRITGVTRTVHISGVNVTTRCLRPLSPQPLLSPDVSTTSQHSTTLHTPSTVTPPQSPPRSPALSDSSELDEETTMMMSQSIVGLPPQPISPSSSVASSMYASAISIAPVTSTVLDAVAGTRPSTQPNSPTTPPLHRSSTPIPPPLQVVTSEIEDETILSFGAEPIVLQLVAPPPTRTAPRSSPRHGAAAESSRERTQETGQANSVDPLRFELTMGVLAVSLRARHVRSLLDVAELWGSHSPEPTPTVARTKEKANSHSILSRIEASLRIRGIVLLLLPANSPSPSDALLADFYKRPLAPPHLPHGFVRIHLESFSSSLVTSPLATPSTTRNSSTVSGTTTSGHLSISEISAFTFLQRESIDGVVTLHASPLLITDQHLAVQYPAQHVHPDLRHANAQQPLPTYDIIDWTEPSRQAITAKMSTWRTRPHQGSSSVPGTPVNRARDIGASPLGRSPVLQSPPRHSPSHKRPLNAPVAHSSAVHIEFSLTSVASSRRSSRSKGKAPDNGLDIEVQVAPLHIFCDTSLLLNKYNPAELSETMLFVNEISTTDTQESAPLDVNAEVFDDSGDEDGEEDADTPPGTPRPQQELYTTRIRERERERDRRRLERLVMEDLDLELDYRQTISDRTGREASGVDSRRKKQGRKNKSRTTVTLKVPALRVEVRNPPPPGVNSRSGAIVLDIHDIRICTGEQPSAEKKAALRFTDTEHLFSPDTLDSPASDDASVLLSASWQRLTFAYAAVGEAKAQMILSVGSLPPGGSPESVAQGISVGSPQLRTTDSPQILPQIVVSKASRVRTVPTSGLPTTALSVEIPSVHVHLGKLELDGLQLWADDLTQAIDRAMNPKPPYSFDTESTKDPSLIGSRFFNKGQRSQGSGNESLASTVTAPRTDISGETIVKVIVCEAAVTLCLPRQSGGIQPFNIVASDIDLLLELKPDGKDETVLTLGVADLSVRETSATNTLQTFLALTTPRNVMSNATQSLLKLRFTSLVVSDSSAKESRIKITIYGLTYTAHPSLTWVAEIAQFAKAPPGVFESVVPSERTRISLKVIDSSVRALCPTHPGALVVHLGEIDFSTVMVGKIPEFSFHLSIQALSLFLVDDVNCTDSSTTSSQAASLSRVSRTGGGIWKLFGYALIGELMGIELEFLKQDAITPPSIKVNVTRGDLRLHLCADTGAALGACIGDFTSIFAIPADGPAPEKSKKGVSVEVAHGQNDKRDLTASLDENAFRRTIPQVGAAPDMIYDDLPSNLEYLDEAFSASAGLRELDDGDLDDFAEDEAITVNVNDQTGIVSMYGGETARLLDMRGLRMVENYFETLPPEAMDESAQYGDTTLKVRVHDFNATVFLYDGYDWVRTRRIIEEEAKEMRRRLAKIRQLVASGQTPDPTVEETNTLLFNSVYIGLDHNVDELESGALIAAIDEELNDDMETASQSSWQSLKHQPASPASPGRSRKRYRKKDLTRSKGPSIEFRLQNLTAEVDNYRSHESLASRILATVRDVEILDHMKTSTWSKFLTSLHTDSRGNIRETDSDMVRFELRKVYPVPGNVTQEARLRAKILPLRLHVDQDALDFMKKFFAFKDPEAAPSAPADPADEMFFQQAEVFPVDLKLDYKPRRVDYRALRDGKTIELMNFFHFDGAEMTLRHITLTGITGWARLGDLLNDLWTPDVKATQLVDVISGVAPIRSVVNVGSGVADLVLLPIAQYKKDGRVVRGLQKGTTAFVKSTATEAIKLGARLATGTQVILEQAENVIGGQFKDSVTAEALQMPPSSPGADEGFGIDVDMDELISRYADQPSGVKEGVKSAYKSLRRNFNSAAQTILAVPMEVYERSGNEGAVRSVVRAVPIAVLKPMIGASEAVSKTLLGLHNTLDPNVRAENEAKYKQR